MGILNIISVTMAYGGILSVGVLFSLCSRLHKDDEIAENGDSLKKHSHSPVTTGTCASRILIFTQYCRSRLVIPISGLVVMMCYFGMSTPSGVFMNLSLSHICPSPKTSLPNATCSMGNAYYGLLVISVASVMIYFRDNYFGIATLVLHILESGSMPHPKAYRGEAVNCGMAKPIEMLVSPTKTGTRINLP